ncbi:helix-turn-helix domain-containing protein, partial [Bacillus thuringiensis]|nr:helix-turn-helix domain-containing protein [Bacillus thuringiensis]
MATLGEKIKTLRKEKKLTQTELVGSELTKSMLSQIENGKATPSMKTLQYIAEKL